MSETLKEIPYNIEKSEAMKPFWDGLNESKLMSTKCSKCNTKHYPPSPILCPHCFGTDMSWIELPLKGTVSSHTKVTAPPAGFDGEYFLASVHMDELDKDILGRYLGDDIAIGDRVHLEFEKVGNQSLFIFTKNSS